MRLRKKSFSGPPPFPGDLGKNTGFSLIEMMAAMAILTVLMLIIFGIVQATSSAWKKSTGRIESLQNARATFESMTRRLSQATLNTYYDYFDKDRDPSQAAAYDGPDVYGRQSELHFVSGKALVGGQVTHAVFFQAPLGYSDDNANYGGLDQLMNACGYYIVHGKDPVRPSFWDTFTSPPKEEYRYRLMDYLQPSQKFNLYTSTSFASSGGGFNWIGDGLSSGGYARTLAQNIVALVILPERSPQEEAEAKIKGLAPLAADFEYDSRPKPGEWKTGAQPVKMHQLPPLVKVVMVAIDDASAAKLEKGAAMPDLGQAQLFKDAGRLDSDLAQFENVLNALPGNMAGNTIKLNYRVFQTEVALRGAKWSE